MFNTPLFNGPNTSYGNVNFGKITVQDNKVRRASHVWDVAGLLRGLGLLPDLS